MPNIVVQLLFSGLIAYSPSGDGSNLVIMVPNGINSPHMPHQAFLTVRSGAVIDDQSDFRFEDDPIEGPPKRRTFVGGGYQLSIASLRGGGLVYEPCRELRPNHVATEKENICLLSASDLMDAGSTASLKALAGTGFSIANEVALRLELDSGNFGPFDQSALENFLTGRQVQWTSPGDKFSRMQFVPELLQWVSPEIAASKLVLTLKPLDGGPTRIVTIAPDGSKPIEILISNEPDPYQYCSNDFSSMRFSADHLKQLARFSARAARGFRTPELALPADRKAIDDFCAELDLEGGRQPVICYGTEMDR